jgi:hypothetical protein
MFKIKDQYILLGSTVDVSWELDPDLRFLFIWYPISWLPWKNYKSIDSLGETSLHVNKKQIEVKIKQLHFWGFKTLYSIYRNVNTIELKNIESKLSLIENATLINHRKHHAEIASLFFNMNGRSMRAKHLTVNPKTKTPSIKNILPIQ